MYTATFIFAKKQYDEDFHLLDGRIAEAARPCPATWARNPGKTRRAD